MSSLNLVLWDGGKLNRELFIKCQSEDTAIIAQYNVLREEVKLQDLTRFRELVESLTDIGSAARESVLCCFAGWDNDRRELAEIREVVAYIQAIECVCPYIWYFLNPLVNNHFFLCLVAHTVISSNVKSLQGQKHVILNVPAANEKLAAMTEAVMTYGARIGDEDGARDVLRDWRCALNL